MSREYTEKMLVWWRENEKVMVHHVNGGAVEMEDCDGDWRYNLKPGWNVSCNYRIKSAIHQNSFDKIKEFSSTGKCLEMVVVDKFQSKEVQEFLFSLGYGWCCHSIFKDFLMYPLYFYINYGGVHYDILHSVTLEREEPRVDEHTTLDLSTGQIVSQKKTKLTVEEIEELLGYKVEVISG